MIKDKKYVKVESTENDNNEVYWKDKHWKIIKIEQKWDPEERANTRRWIAVLLRLIAITFEIIWILRVTEVINWFSNIDTNYFLIACIVLDLIFFIIWSSLWKKANRIDPISEKNKAKFRIWNNLWTILSVLAFLPMIIFVFSNKNLDKKSKSIVWGIAIVALAIAWLSSYDFNPVSSEQLLRAEQEVLQVSPTWTIYWAEHSKKYHVDKDCPAFSNSKTVYEWTVRDAYERGLTDPCRRCIPEYKWEENWTNETGDNNEIINKVWDLLSNLQTE
jgi:hypothetical protein